MKRLVLILLLSCLPPGSVRSDDVVTYLGGREGKQTIRRTGKIEDYTGQGLVIVTTQGREETIPPERVLEIQTSPSPQEAEGDKLREQGKLAEAAAAYERASKREARAWVARQITARLVGCYDLLGQVDEAGDSFLALVSADDESPYFPAIPLPWRSSTLPADAPARATKWLERSDSPAAQLLGASWLLGSAQQQRAIEVLKGLSSDLDPRIAHLATAQLWRTTLVAASADDVARWQQQLSRVPVKVRGGPLLVVGDALARQQKAEDALLCYLQVPLLHRNREALAAEGYLAAARLLDKAERTDDASRLYRELTAKYPAFARRHSVPSGR